MKKVRLLIWSDAVVQTGFSRVMHSIVKNFPPKKYEIYWLGINYYGDPHDYKNLKIYPASTGGDILGYNRVPDILNIAKPDIIFALSDIWQTNDFLSIIKTYYKGKTLPKIVVYFPVDAYNHDSNWYSNLDIVTVPVTYTKFGKEVATLASKREDIRIIPHGVDNNEFFKLPYTKKEIKKGLYPNNTDFFDDSFVVLNANRNQPRKKLNITMEGFAIFAQGKPENVKLYMHCGLTDSSIDIPLVAKYYGIQNRLIVTGTNNGPLQVPIKMLNTIYNASDVGINTSIGEGWGLVSIEHVVSGAPQLLPNHSACQELFSGCGLLMDVSQWVMQDKIMTIGGLVDPNTVAKGLSMLYEDKNLYNKLSILGMEKFSSPEYSWESISKQWDSIFDEVLNANNLSK